MSPGLQLAANTTAAAAERLRRATGHLMDLRKPEGYWWGDLTADSTLESNRHSYDTTPEPVGGTVPPAFSGSVPESVTTAPPESAAPVNVTVPKTTSPPITVLLLSVIEASATLAVTVSDGD